MKTYLKDLEQERKLNPCTDCNHGSGSYSNGKDKNGEYIESKSCKDHGNCFEYEIYKNKLNDNKNNKLSINNTIEKIREILTGTDRKTDLKILSEIIGDDYELPLASNLIAKDFDPCLSKEDLLEYQYLEGNEECGCIDLSTVLNFAEEVLNCDDEYEDVEFQYFVRPETQEEIEEEKRDSDITWLVEDENVNIKDLRIQFEMD